MNLQQQLTADLERVFFADFNDTATVDGRPVLGKFSTNPHEFEQISGARQTFSGPAHLLSSVTRNSVVVIRRDGQDKAFKVIGRPERVNDLIYLPLEEA